MRKYFHGSALFLCILALCGCSGGGGSAADPMGTGTVQFIDETGAVLFPETTGNPLVFVVMPGETRQLIVWVTNAREGGATIVPVIGEEVTFSLLTPGNGGSITMVKDETDGNGRAVALYTAGNNFTTDEIRVTTGVGATAHVTIMKQGGIVGSRISSLTPSSTSVAAGQTSIITAMVTDGNGNPIMGETVTFTLPVNESGASFVSASGAGARTIQATTDIVGEASVIYYAGSASATIDLYDTVRATLANGSMKSVVITRSAATPPTTTPTTPTTTLSIAVAASPASVTAGQVSVITATLTGDDKVGVTVTFTLPVTGSGAPTLSAATATTDGSGKAVVIYQPGTTNPTLTVQDTVQAAVGTATSAVAITRTGSAASAYSITVTASPTTLALDNSNSVITANVKNNAGTVVSGVTVTFTVTGGGTVPAPGTATTDGNGNAVTVFTGGGAPATGETDVVTATDSGTTYTAAVIITYP